MCNILIVCVIYNNVLYIYIYLRGYNDEYELYEK